MSGFAHELVEASARGHPVLFRDLTSLREEPAFWGGILRNKVSYMGIAAL